MANGLNHSINSLDACGDCSLVTKSTMVDNKVTKSVEFMASFSTICFKRSKSKAVFNSACSWLWGGISATIRDRASSTNDRNPERTAFLGCFDSLTRSELTLFSTKPSTIYLHEKVPPSLLTLRTWANMKVPLSGVSALDEPYHTGYTPPAATSENKVISDLVMLATKRSSIVWIIILFNTSFPPSELRWITSMRLASLRAMDACLVGLYPSVSSQKGRRGGSGSGS
mmetsp:Transcript_22522/g.38150  ORF Transcript_22522/g.38150 Transcript_22522/m.38150 type:complete len:227 (-) Transcript_22522:1301-1981(-)